MVESATNAQQTGSSEPEQTRLVVLPTVPGTGTHLMRDHILAGQNVYARHPYPEEVEKIIDKLSTPGSICVVPVRRYEEVAATWSRSGRDMDGFGGWTLQQWYQVLFGIIEPFDPIFISIDEPDMRDIQLERLEDQLGVSLPHDWPIVRAT